MKNFSFWLFSWALIGVMTLFLGLPPKANEEKRIRDLKSFQPSEDTTSHPPDRYLYQLLLDREKVEDFDSYLLQVLFRGDPPDSHSVQMDSNLILLDFHNTGKASNRITKISNGVIESSEIGIFKKSTRLLLYTSQSIQPTIRHTIDRTLIHFKVPSNKH